MKLKLSITNRMVNPLRLMVIVALYLTTISNVTAQTTKLVLPTQSQAKWNEAELGVVFHYDLHVFDNVRYNQTTNRITPIEDYNIFNPRHLDTDQWVRSAKAAGAKFALLTATHETGFGLWQSDVNPYCMKALKWHDGKGDIVKDFVTSCRKYGIEPGIYLGIRWNSFLGIHDFKAEGAEEFAHNRQQWYRHYCERMVEEICSRYGKLFMIWFDGGADDPHSDGPDVEPIIRRLQPDCLFYHNVEHADLRWAGTEGGVVGNPCWSTFPYPFSHSDRTKAPVGGHNNLLAHGDPNGAYWVPAMADTPLRAANNRHEWFWEPNDENTILSVPTLMDKYNKSVGRNATLIVGLTPDTTGLLPKTDVKRLAEWGKEIARCYNNPIAKTYGKNTTLKLQKTSKVNTCILREQIEKGERIREYKIEAKVQGKWKTIANGQSVGNKRIIEFPTIETTALRLIIVKSIATPFVKDFSVYHK